MANESKCPFTGGSHAHTNRDWWPNQRPRRRNGAIERRYCVLCRRRASSASSIVARELCLQKAPYRRIRFEADGALVGFGDRLRVAGTRQQRCARGPVGLMLGKLGIVLQRIER